MPLILRSTKGSPLTFNELDGNFTYLSESIASGSGGGTPATASYAETATSASYASNADVATSSTSASYALSASYAPAANPFPYVGTAEFTGSILVSGSIIPNVDGVSSTSSFSLGSPTAAWKDIYVSNGTINFLDGAGNVQGTLSSTTDGISTDGDAYFNEVRVGRGGGDIPSNIVVGQNSLTLTSSFGFGNIAIGDQSLQFNAGYFNTAVGLGAIQFNTIGLNNVGIGNASLYFNSVGQENTGVGNGTLYSNMSGSSNTTIGYNSLNRISSGSFNTALGYKAGFYSSGSSNNNVYIGSNAGPASNTVENNKLYINNTASSTPLIGGDFSAKTVTISGSFSVSGSIRNSTLRATTDGVSISDRLEVSGSIFLTTPGQLNQFIQGTNHFVGGSPGVIGIHIQGRNNQIGAAGEYSHVEGVNNRIDGYACHAEGEGIIISQFVTGSHAEGYQTKIANSVNYAHAEGFGTIVSGSYSHAEGAGTIVIGNSSHAEGLETIAKGNFQHVAGQYNATSSIDSAFIVGNGIDGDNRSNLIFAAEETVSINNLLKLEVRSTNPPVPLEGMIMASGSAGSSKLYYYNGTSWVDLTA